MKRIINLIICFLLLFAVVASAVMTQMFSSWAELKSSPNIVIARCTVTPNPEFKEVPDWWELSMGEITNLHFFASKINAKSDELSAFLYDHLENAAIRFLSSSPDSKSDAASLEALLVIELNRVLDGPSIYDANRFQNIKLRLDTEALRQSNPKGIKLVQLNRMLLEDAYPTAIAKKQFNSGLIRSYWKDGVINSDIDVTFILKGSAQMGASELRSTYSLPQQGNYYLIFASHYDGHFQALEDYRIVPLGNEFSPDSLIGKSFDDQIDILVKARLDHLKGSPNLDPNEKRRLEDELQR